MICPHCKKETASIYRHCQNCNEDLEKYREERNKAIEGTGDMFPASGFSLEMLLGNLGIAGGLILVVISLLWYYAGLSVNKHYFYPPTLFVFGVYCFLAGIRKRRKIKELREKKKNGEILD